MQLEIEIKKNDVLSSLTSVNDFGNSILYKLCEENFTHNLPEKIIAKTNMIGRIYAVALDRGKDKNKPKDEKKKNITDDFFPKVVVPIFKNSKLDKMLLDLKVLKKIDDNMQKILSAHFYLMKKLVTINGEYKRSFSSKYLHFHLRDLFFIYDSRAVSSINKIISVENNDLNINQNKTDEQYSIFFHKSLFLQTFIKGQFDIELTPRQLDNYLLISANEHLRNKNKKKIITVSK